MAPDPVPPPASDTPITRRSTVEQFLKDHTGLRVGPEPIDLFCTLVNDLAREVVARAGELAQADSQRTTLLSKDITEAYRSIVWTAGGGGAPPDPAILFTLIDRLTTDQLADLVKKINEWLASQVSHP